MINTTVLLTILCWWWLFFTLGVIFLPLTQLIFSRLWDKGYGLSKIFALLGLSYLAWILATFKIAPFRTTTLWGIIVIFSLLGYLTLKKQRKTLKKKLSPIVKIAALEELIFLGGLTGWTILRTYQPAIQGLEKFMDFGFINSIVRSDFFPPADMWLAGEKINYYYFGHLISAVVTKLSGLDTAVTYNLMVATIFALTLSGGFSFGANLIHAGQKRKGIPSQSLKITLAGGVLTALILTFGGNLHPLYWYTKNKNFDDYWYPDATRFITEKFGAADNTIHEFPLYSFVVADLHGHMVNIPNVIFSLSLILALCLETNKNRPQSKKLQMTTLAFSLAISLMTNAWDYPIYLFLTGAVFLLARLRINTKNLIKPVIESIKFGFYLASASALIASPFIWQFKNITEGLALTDFHTPAWMLLVLWGWPMFLSLSFARIIASRKKFQRIDPVDLVVLTLMGSAWFLIAVPELIYVRDIYTHSHQRANTMFKLTYQSFIIFSLISGYAIVRPLNLLKKNITRATFLIACLIFSIFIFIYPQKAIVSYYTMEKNQGLHGLNYLQSRYPDDYSAIKWLNNQARGQPVIVEAVGDSYTDFARVSANTGLPTIIGWPVHEWLWRGSFDEPAERTEEVKLIYESDDISLTKQLLDKYRVEYIFIGTLERRKYRDLNESKFLNRSQIVFSSGKTKIYRQFN